MHATTIARALQDGMTNLEWELTVHELSGGYSSALHLAVARMFIACHWYVAEHPERFEGLDFEDLEQRMYELYKEVGDATDV